MKTSVKHFGLTVGP